MVRYCTVLVIVTSIAVRPPKQERKSISQKDHHAQIYIESNNVLRFYIMYQGDLTKLYNVHFFLVRKSGDSDERWTSPTVSKRPPVAVHLSFRLMMLPAFRWCARHDIKYLLRFSYLLFFNISCIDQLVMNLKKTHIWCKLKNKQNQQDFVDK